AAKTDVAGGRIDRLALPRRGPVAQAVVGRAEVGTALYHAASDMRARLARRATGFFAALGRLGKRTRRPLPDVAEHVVEAIPVGGKGIDGRGALVSIELEVLPRESALPGIGHRPPVGGERFPPRVGRALEAAAGREFPFGFDRQLLSSPGRVGTRIFVSDVHDGMVIATGDAAVGTLGMSPIGA